MYTALETAADRHPASVALRLPAITAIAVVAVAVGALVVGGTGLGLALSAGATTPVSTSGGCNSSQPRLTVQGTGQADGTPDVLTAVFGFSSSAPSATAALSQNNDEVNQALMALSSNGVAQSDVQTTGLTLAPQYVYAQRRADTERLCGHQHGDGDAARHQDRGRCDRRRGERDR